MIEAIGALILGALAALTMWRRELAKRKAAESRAEKAEGYAETRKRIDDSGDIPVDDPDDWLRDRAKGKR